MRRMKKRIRLTETKSNALRLIVISKHLFPAESDKGEDRKTEPEDGFGTCYYLMQERTAETVADVGGLRRD